MTGSDDGVGCAALAQQLLALELVVCIAGVAVCYLNTDSRCWRFCKCCRPCCCSYLHSSTHDQKPCSDERCGWTSRRRTHHAVAHIVQDHTKQVEPATQQNFPITRSQCSDYLQLCPLCKDQVHEHAVWATSLILVEGTHLCLAVTRRLEIRTTCTPAACATSATLPLPW